MKTGRRLKKSCLTVAVVTTGQAMAADDRVVAVVAAPCLQGSFRGLRWIIIPFLGDYAF